MNVSVDVGGVAVVETKYSYPLSGAVIDDQEIVALVGVIAVVARFMGSMQDGIGSQITSSINKFV